MIRCLRWLWPASGRAAVAPVRRQSPLRRLLRSNRGRVTPGDFAVPVLLTAGGGGTAMVLEPCLTDSRCIVGNQSVTLSETGGPAREPERFPGVKVILAQLPGSGGPLPGAGGAPKNLGYSEFLGDLSRYYRGKWSGPDGFGASIEDKVAGCLDGSYKWEGCAEYVGAAYLGHRTGRFVWQRAMAKMPGGKLLWYTPYTNPYGLVSIPLDAGLDAILSRIFQRRFPGVYADLDARLKGTVDTKLAELERLNVDQARFSGQVGRAIAEITRLELAAENPRFRLTNPKAQMKAIWNNLADALDIEIVRASTNVNTPDLTDPRFQRIDRALSARGPEAPAVSDPYLLEQQVRIAERGLGISEGEVLPPSEPRGGRVAQLQAELAAVRGELRAMDESVRRVGAAGTGIVDEIQALEARLGQLQRAMPGAGSPTTPVPDEVVARLTALETELGRVSARLTELAERVDGTAGSRRVTVDAAMRGTPHPAIADKMPKVPLLTHLPVGEGGAPGRAGVLPTLDPPTGAPADMPETDPRGRRWVRPQLVTAANSPTAPTSGSMAKARKTPIITAGGVVKGAATGAGIGVAMQQGFEAAGMDPEAAFYSALGTGLGWTAVDITAALVARSPEAYPMLAPMFAAVAQSWVGRGILSPTAAVARVGGSIAAPYAVGGLIYSLFSDTTDFERYLVKRAHQMEMEERGVWGEETVTDFFWTLAPTLSADALSDFEDRPELVMQAMMELYGYLVQVQGVNAMSTAAVFEHVKPANGAGYTRQELVGNVIPQLKDIWCGEQTEQALEVFEMVPDNAPPWFALLKSPMPCEGTVDQQLQWAMELPGLVGQYANFRVTAENPPPGVPEVAMALQLINKSLAGVDAGFGSAARQEIAARLTAESLLQRPSTGANLATTFEWARDGLSVEELARSGTQFKEQVVRSYPDYEFGKVVTPSAEVATTILETLASARANLNDRQFAAFSAPLVGWLHPARHSVAVRMLTRPDFDSDAGKRAIIDALIAIHGSNRRAGITVNDKIFKGGRTQHLPASVLAHLDVRLRELGVRRPREVYRLAGFEFNPDGPTELATD